MVTLVPPKRATSLGGTPAASAHEIPECRSVYGVTASASPAASLGERTLPHTGVLLLQAADEGDRGRQVRGVDVREKGFDQLALTSAI